jgi:hypothetical protein
MKIWVSIAVGKETNAVEIASDMGFDLTTYL